jgi:hypothetical protein
VLAELGLTAQDVSRAIVETVARLEHVRTGGEDVQAASVDEAIETRVLDQDGPADA